MTGGFRAALLAALAAAIIATMIPFAVPLKVSFAIDQPPLGMMLVGFLSLTGSLLAIVAWVGLLLFKRWSRPMAVVAGLMLVAVWAAQTLLPPFKGHLAASSIAASGGALALWAIAIALAYSRALADRFNAAGR